ncbi:FHA domain-containing protein [Thalassoglobus polymorphus]|uniref:Glycogen accumulation regulator GarA n=1 Tax=Thalassoglobus polymorphus TaxID=2527994 RepID=A0A517QT24_9PLAN|nr:FHA domain-containing protein [Thalassoglobus polymorphus]QDT34697.1 Glycogen accumulation regulator GarA [Thalassoglobus polymorphus]
MIAKLIPTDGSQPIAIDRNLTIVGRKKGLCDLVLDNSSISKVHCAVAKTDGLLFIRDLGSTNGTKVNGQRVSRGALLPGDEIAFANVKFRVHLGPDEVEAAEQTEKLLSLPKLIDTSEDEEEGELVSVDSENDLPLISDD